MRVKEWFTKNMRAVAMFLGILLAITIIGVVILRFFRNAKLAVMVAPIDAKVKINGIEYSNGNHKFFAGKVSVEVSKEGFDTQKFEIELKSKETKTLYVALSQSGNYNWYKRHSEDYDALKLIASDDAKSFIEKTETSKQIISVLPLRYVTTLTNGNNAPDGRPFYETILTNGTSDKKCKTIFCLKLQDNTGDEKIARRLVEEAGFNYDDYEIIHE